MRKILAALVALSFTLPVAANPPKQLRQIDDGVEPPDPGPGPGAAQPPQGSTVLVPPLISVGGAGQAESMKVLRLPVQAGKVSKMVATNLLANSRSWIAKGHKYYSLCMPDGGKVACAPIVATSTMKDIEVGAYAGMNGEPKLTFRIAPGTTQESKRLIASINYFLARTGKQIAHFEQKAANSAPAKAGTPGRISPSLLELGGCGGGDCSGGDSGSDGGGHEGDSYDWSDGYFGDEDTWDDPDTAEFPDFPAGDNGDADPCMDGGGNNICQQVVIREERPEPPEFPAFPQAMALTNCIVSPWAVACNRSPPPVVGGDPSDQLPRGPTPWLPQSACNVWGALCSAGQEPKGEPAPPTTEEERRARAQKACYDKASGNMLVCRSLQGIMGDAWFNTCRRNALDEARECGLVGMDR